MIKKLSIAACLSTMALCAAANNTDIWVSAGTTSAPDGSESAPFASLDEALGHLRMLRRQIPESEIGSVRIIMKGGTYRLSETIRISSADSGSGEFPLLICAADGETPVISGAISVGPWNDGDVSPDGLPEIAAGHIWESTIPSVGSESLSLRQMWVNGMKMPRASSFDGDVTSTMICADKKAKTITVPRLNVDYSPRLEMTIIQDWAMNVMRVKSVSHSDNRSTLTFMDEEAEIEFKRPWPILRADEDSHSNHHFFISNAIGLLNRPQEWFADIDNGKIYYWPRYGEDASSLDARIPILETLLRIDGGSDNGGRASDITFRGIAFEHSTWHRPATNGHVALQAGQYLLDAYSQTTATADNVAWVGRPAAAVSVSHAERISFENCHFRHNGSTALDFVEAVGDCKVRGCTFSDIGGTAILAGFFGDENFEVHQPYNPADLSTTVDGLTISNNYITDIANEDWGCVAIGIGFASRVDIRHNEICATPYSAISMGWGWVNQDNIMHDNHITNNFINGFALQMRDSGAIYTLSSQPGSSITGNRIEGAGDPAHNPVMWDMRHSQFDIYTDEGSDFFTVRDNWCERGEISKNRNGAHNTWGKNNASVDPVIKENAGLQPAYEAIKNFVVKPGYAPADSIIEPATAATIEYIAPGVGFKTGHAIAVDLNADDLPDIAYSGGESFQVQQGGVRINRGDYVFANGSPLKRLFMGNFAAGDVDGDGDIDLVQAGWDFWNSYNALLLNDGSGRLVEHRFASTKQSSPACGIADLDNNGFPDCFFIGNNTDNAFYMQKSDRTFTDAESRLPLGRDLRGLSDPSIIYADFDNDGATDIALLSKISKDVFTRIFFNDGTGNFTVADVGFEERGTRGAMAFADVNADGLLDIAIGGCLPDEQWDTPASKGGKTVVLYLNNGDRTFSRHQEFAEYMFDSTTAPLRFCDWNNDGHSDLIVSGWNISGDNISRTDIYLNDGHGNFSLCEYALPGVSESSLEIADFGRRGINDILISGNVNGAAGYNGYSCDRRIAVLCRNNTTRANTAPSAPSDLSASIDGNSVTLAWAAASDAETPAKALSYNYYLRDADSGRYLTFPNSNPEDGTRRVSACGNAGMNLRWRLNNLPAGNYVWSVQAIDAGYAGSVFAPEQSFTIDAGAGIGKPLSAAGAEDNVREIYNLQGIRIEAMDSPGIYLVKTDAGGFSKVYIN